MTATARTPESYKKALAELDGLLQELESEDIDVDGLEAKVEKAATLLKYCKARLSDTEAKVKKVISSLSDDGAKPETPVEPGATAEPGCSPENLDDSIPF